MVSLRIIPIVQLCDTGCDEVAVMSLFRSLERIMWSSNQVTTVHNVTWIPSRWAPISKLLKHDKVDKGGHVETHESAAVPGA